MEAESRFTDAKDEAVEEWSSLLCNQLNESRNLKKNGQSLENSNGNILFEEEDKEKVLEDTFFKGKHLNANNFDNDFYMEIMDKYNSITLSEEVDEEEGYINDEIRDSLISTLLYIFNKSITEGRIPIQWKRANVKCLKKPGKSNYNNPSSYRPISLTSVLGKTMERIITNRIECFVESENILDKEQEGFQNFRSTTNALLNFTQSIMDGFNIDDFTLAVLIDFEKAYDTELVAIKLVLDYISRVENKTIIEEEKIFSDSQSAIGISSFNWKIKNHRSTSHEIISLIKSIQKHHGIKINFEWTPGHADVRGNEIADKLAKEAAKEANEIEKEAHITVTKQDIKTAARILVNKKWQHRWDNSDTGRLYYNFHHNVNEKLALDFPDHKT
ncbi:unnamed protein product [Mytilus coruscus]|uniref:RNase H type-1 domain-containing protein n=1 Tax=Mytilus coruscus TaxID=42192 RepID=A0A6J8D4J6_MYTCO|nr:unnamed protein product [Mytilus coruscus]